MSPASGGSRRGALARLADGLGPPLGALLIRSIRRMVRLRVVGRETVERFAREDVRYVHVFWHAHLLLMVYSYVGPRLAFMISQHRDGELVAKTVERFGYVPVRGSTTRGGSSALRAMLRALWGGADIGFTPDGPRGPSRRVQPGCVAAARLAGVPVVPVALAATRAWYLRTWDRFCIPKPGARVLMAYGEPLSFAPDEPIDQGCRRLEEAMNDLEAFAGENAGARDVGTRA